MSSHDTEKRRGRRWLRVVIAMGTVFAATAVGLFVGASSSQAITCTSGKIPGFTVTSGTTCIENATVTGSISVSSGASLEVYYSTVKGSISGTGADHVIVCGSKMASVSIQHATGYVEIGEPDADCAGNVIQGGLSVANNNDGYLGGAWVECNRIGGSWLVVNNSDNNIDLGNHHKGSGPSFCSRENIP